MLSITGLSEAEVLHRRANGDGNALDLHTSRSYWDIARTNLFNFFNNLLFAIGIALVALGLYNDAFTSVGLALVNALISAIQEIHAKRKLDAIALLTRPRVTVVRDGSERQVDASELVRGDIVRVQAGRPSDARWACGGRFDPRDGRIALDRRERFGAEEVWRSSAFGQLLRHGLELLRGREGRPRELRQPDDPSGPPLSGR